MASTPLTLHLAVMPALLLHLPGRVTAQTRARSTLNRPWLRLCHGCLVDRTELVTAVGRAVILMAQLEEALQDLVYAYLRTSGGTRKDVNGKSGKALKEQLEHAGLDAWVARYEPLSVDRNAVVHSIWYAGGSDGFYARRYRQGGEGVWDTVASSLSDDRFAAFVRDVENALVDAVNDLWRAVGLPHSFVYAHENLPV